MAFSYWKEAAVRTMDPLRWKARRKLKNGGGVTDGYGKEDTEAHMSKVSG